MHSAATTEQHHKGSKHGAAITLAQPHSGPVCAEHRRSPLFLRDLAHHIYLEITLGNEALESGIFLFQLAQAPHVANLQLAVSLAPGVYRLLAYCVALRNLRYGPSIGLAQNLDHLVFGESALYSWLSLLAVENHLLKKLVVRKT